MHNDVILCSSEDICNAFCRHFSSAESPGIEKYNASHIQRSDQSFCYIPKDEFEIPSVKSGVRTTASGEDCIPEHAIKLVKDDISPVLAHIINNVFSSGIFPHRLNFPKVFPIFLSKHRKKNEELSARIHTLFLSKVVEKLIVIRLNKYHKRIQFSQMPRLDLGNAI